jgi:hypothetical protein
MRRGVVLCRDAHVLELVTTSFVKLTCASNSQQYRAAPQERQLDQCIRTAK